MNLHIDASSESINKYNEELCGDKVEIVRNSNSIIAVLADGLGSGVKANILSTLTSKIISTMMVNGSNIDEAVETIASTLPVCMERDIAYCTFSILQLFKSGEGYLAEFDNPSAIYLRNGRFIEFESEERSINDKLVKESRFKIEADDTIVMISDGVVHAGIGATLNLGWKWENVREYVERIYKSSLSAKSIAKQLMQVCESLYTQVPGDDTTVVAVKVRKPVKVNIMVGPPVDRQKDEFVVRKFFSQEGKKVVCGGTTSQIVSRVLGREIVTSLNYYNPSIPPTAKIEGVDLTTEGILTLGKTLEFTKKYFSSGSTVQDIQKINEQHGVSRLAKILLEESTSVHFFIGRAMNPAHQNPEYPLDLSIKFKLVEELAKYLRDMGKEVSMEYF